MHLIFAQLCLRVLNRNHLCNLDQIRSLHIILAHWMDVIQPSPCCSEFDAVCIGTPMSLRHTLFPSSEPAGYHACSVLWKMSPTNRIGSCQILSKTACFEARQMLVSVCMHGPYDVSVLGIFDMTQSLETVTVCDPTTRQRLPEPKATVL